MRLRDLLATELGLPGVPPEAEELMIARDLLLNRSIGARYHVQHISTARSVDLILLRYLQPYLRPDVLDVMIDMSVQGRDAGAIVGKVWDVFVRGQRRTYAVEPLLDDKGAFLPDRFGAHRARDYRFDARAWNGRERTYMVFYEFLFPEMRPPASTVQCVSPLRASNA